MTPLATVEELEIHLQHTITPDGAADLALAGASGVVRGYCGWNLLLEETTFHVMGDGVSIINLPTLHLTDVPEIRIDGVAVEPTDSQQPIWTQRGQIIRLPYWPTNAKIEVDVEHGYAEVPDLLRLVTLTVAARILQNPEDAKEATVGSVSRTYETSLTALELRLLDTYRL